MNTTFDDIIIGVLEREGGFVDHPDDRGGATNFGVTIETLRRHNIDVDSDGDIDSRDVKELPLETAKRLYGEQYWQPSRAGDLPVKFRELYFDMCINHGVRNAVSILQQAANHAGQRLVVDGVIGPKTIVASYQVLLEGLVHQRARFYCRIVEKDHSQVVFLEGWINRCFEFLMEAPE